MKRRSMLPGAAAMLLAGACALWSATVWADADYPAVIESQLGITTLPGTPAGSGSGGYCDLCHLTAAGGDGLNDFGGLLKQRYGLVGIPDSPNTLKTALEELEMQDPALYKDLEAGKNPNDDPVLTGEALPQPQFGCAGQLSTATAVPRQMWVAALACVVAVWLRRRRVR